MGKSLLNLPFLVCVLGFSLPLVFAASPVPTVVPQKAAAAVVAPAATPDPQLTAWPTNVPFQVGGDGAKTVTEITAPCKKDDDKSPGSLGLRTCKVFIPEAVKAIEKRVHNQTDCLYDGVVLDPTALKMTYPKTQCVGPKFGKETCNVADSHFNTPATVEDPAQDGPQEILSNHLGTSCGTSIEMHVSCSSDGSCVVTPDATGDYGTQEDAYTRGTLVAAAGCYYAQVTQGIVADTKVKVSSWGSQIGPCGAAATDYMYKMASAKQTAETLAKALEGQPNIADIENCPDFLSEQKKIEDTTELGKLRQSACLLRAGRHAIEALYEHIAVCEVIARASYSRDKFLDAFFDRLTCPNPGDKQNCVDPTVKKRIRTIINKCDGNPSDASATKCYRRVYLGLWEAAQGIKPTNGVKTKISKPLWPQDGSCSVDYSAGLVEDD